MDNKMHEYRDYTMQSTAMPDSLMSVLSSVKWG